MNERIHNSFTNRLRWETQPIMAPATPLNDSGGCRSAADEVQGLLHKPILDKPAAPIEGSHRTA